MEGLQTITGADHAENIDLDFGELPSIHWVSSGMQKMMYRHTNQFLKTMELDIQNVYC